MADRTELEDQVARLTALVEEMRGRIARMEGPARHVAIEEPRSRRDLLKLGGAAALGAVGAAALRAVPAAAATGDPVLAGNANSANATTTLSGTAAGTPIEVLGVQAFDFVPADLTAALGTFGQFGGAVQGLGGISGDTAPDLRDGVDGWASGPAAFGVYGLTDTGVGVAGESGAGVAVYARGSGRIQQDPHNLDVNGLPDYIPGDMEQVRDDAGTLWLSNAAGNWRRASTFEVFPTPGRVYGKGVFLNKGQAVLGVDATKTINLAPSGLPAGATAAWCAVAAAEPAVLSFYPTGTPDPHFSAYGVMGTATFGLQVSYLMIPLNAAGKFSFTNVKSRARIYIDVWGYLTQS